MDIKNILPISLKFFLFKFFNNSETKKKNNKCDGVSFPNSLYLFNFAIT